MYFPGPTYYGCISEINYFNYNCSRNLENCVKSIDNLPNINSVTKSLSIQYSSPIPIFFGTAECTLMLMVFLLALKVPISSGVSRMAKILLVSCILLMIALYLVLGCFYYFKYIFTQINQEFCYDNYAVNDFFSSLWRHSIVFTVFFWSLVAFFMFVLSLACVTLVAKKKQTTSLSLNN